MYPAVESLSDKGFLQVSYKKKCRSLCVILYKKCFKMYNTYTFKKYRYTKVYKQYVL